MAVDIKLRLIATVNQDYIVLIFYVFAALLLIEYPAAKMIKGIGIIYLFSKLLRSLVISERYCRQPPNNIYRLLHNRHCRGYFMEEEESKQINKTLNDLSVKIEELNKSILKILGEKKEYAEAKINENPLAYVAGAFVGGVIVGYVMGRGKG